MDAAARDEHAVPMLHAKVFAVAEVDEGGVPIDLEEAWRAHRIHAGYLVLASFLSLVPPYNGPDQRAFSEAFRRRATEAILDLGAAESMRAALGR